MPGSLTTREDKLKAVELSAIFGYRKVAASLNLNENTVKDWCYRYFNKEYRDFREGSQSEWRANLAAEMEDLAQNYGQVERKALEKAEEMLDDPEIDARDVASLIKGMGAARASAASVGQKARGEPDETVQHVVSFPDLERIEAAIRRAGSIEGSATDLPAGELHAG